MDSARGQASRMSSLHLDYREPTTYVLDSFCYHYSKFFEPYALIPFCAILPMHAAFPMSLCYMHWPLTRLTLQLWRN